MHLKYNYQNKPPQYVCDEVGDNKSMGLNHYLNKSLDVQPLMEAPGQRRVDASTGWAMRETESESSIYVLFWKEMIH